MSCKIKVVPFHSCLAGWFQKSGQSLLVIDKGVPGSLGPPTWSLPLPRGSYLPSKLKASSEVCVPPGSSFLGAGPSLGSWGPRRWGPPRWPKVVIRESLDLLAGTWKCQAARPAIEGQGRRKPLGWIQDPLEGRRKRRHISPGVLMGIRAHGGHLGPQGWPQLGHVLLAEFGAREIGLEVLGLQRCVGAWGPRGGEEGAGHHPSNVGCLEHLIFMGSVPRDTSSSVAFSLCNISSEKFPDILSLPEEFETLAKTDFTRVKCV